MRILKLNKYRESKVYSELIISLSSLFRILLKENAIKNEIYDFKH